MSGFFIFCSMKPVLFILLLFFSSASLAQHVKEYRRKNRLIVLVTVEENNPKNNQQLKVLQENKLQLQERDIVILQRKPNSKDLTDFSLEKDFEGVLLIGKDGGIKLREPFLVSPQTIFDLVDAMPMRRAEMRKKN